GYDVDMAFSGKEGLDKLLEEDYDCVVLDVVMPEMDGLEVMRKIRASRLDVWVPVILITGKNVIEDERRVFSLGAVDYIKKPFEFDELLKRVDLSAERGKILRRFQGKKKFSGKIDLLLIQHIIGFISIGQLSGMLQVTNVDMEGVLFFLNGNLANIRLEEQVGMKNFDEIMDWKDGIYSFVEWETGLEMTIETLEDMLFFTELEEGSYILRCESGGKKGEIHIQGGNIVYVEGNGLRGEDALKDILTWRKGTLHIEKTDRLKKGVKLKKSISEILLETSRFKIKKSKPEELKKEEEEKKIEGKKEDIKEKVKIEVRVREEEEKIKEEIKGKKKEEIKMEDKKRVEEELKIDVKKLNSV
ncbi:response regulator, partial [candidate division WOR-3 bacterium]|nr:response regulator [candidate division WOR-3 bacterium]